METNKFKALKSFLDEQKISRSELEHYLNNPRIGSEYWFHSSDTQGLVPMPLPLVYNSGHTFIVRNGLDWEAKEDLWGIEILPNVIMSLRRGTVETPKGFVPNTCYNVLNRIKNRDCGGCMPSAALLKKHVGVKEIALLEGTLKRLREEGIDAGCFLGVCWCYDNVLENKFGVFSLGTGNYDQVSSLTEQYIAYTRIVIVPKTF